jgi:hypothetical protein
MKDPLPLSPMNVSSPLILRFVFKPDSGKYGLQFITLANFQRTRQGRRLDSGKKLIKEVFK